MVIAAAAIGGGIGRETTRYLMQPSQQKAHDAIYSGNLRAIESMTFPKKLDDVTTLASAEAQGVFMHYYYVLDDENYSVPATFLQQQRPTVTKQVCGSSMKSTMKHGAVYQYHYRTSKNRDLGSFTVAHADCG